eukprot:scaffold20734_cov118-Isochrysis_galbana.AAC.1
MPQHHLQSRAGRCLMLEVERQQPRPQPCRRPPTDPTAHWSLHGRLTDGGMPTPPNSAAIDENRKKESSAVAAQARCMCDAPPALGAYTRRSDRAVCERISPSANTPAACQTPLQRRASNDEKPDRTSLHVSDLSAESQQLVSSTTRDSSPASSLETRPPREESTTRDAPCAANQLVVIDASPPLPPVSKCIFPTDPSISPPETKITTFPEFRPLCSHRNADTASLSILNNEKGSPCSSPRSARNDNRCNALRVHHGACSIVLSRASTTYWRHEDDATHMRLADHTPRLPISTKRPLSRRNAAEHAIKSAEKLFNTQCRRDHREVHETPTLNAPASRELATQMAKPKDRR